MTAKTKIDARLDARLAHALERSPGGRLVIPPEDFALFEPWDRPWAGVAAARTPDGGLIIDSKALNEPPTRSRRRRPTLAAVARAATKAGIAVARYEVRADGSISIVTGKPGGDIKSDDTTSPDPRWN